MFVRPGRLAVWRRHDDARGTRTSWSWRLESDSSELLLRPEDVELLSMKVAWIYEACRTGRLPFLRIGKHFRFTRPGLER